MGSETGRSPKWALDPDVVQRALAPATRKPRSWLLSRLGIVVAIALAAAGVVVGAIITMASAEMDPVAGNPVPAVAAPVTTSAPAATPTPTPAPPPPVPACAPERSGGLTVGNGPGDTASGAAAILGFEYAYYTERNGGHAQDFVARDTVNISSADHLQRAIDAEIPVGTTHCVHIVERAPDQFDVDVEERRPAGEVIVYRQHMSIVVRDGRQVIYEISDRP
ncbi:hypothetical protein BJY24_001180 [Nocardia transvalensis]|uniref:DUF8176 domain-containing protein n=1 Tax=Nocardia transvalensis TaxID=37333 RepID=A0A7W9PAT1_9NOCA|nr:hypothetical protein [Nocardia transvalensis]MBB5912313.1 hypothetical protein [Nocardia transvalensis]